MTQRLSTLLVLSFLSLCWSHSTPASAQDGPGEEAKLFHHSELRKTLTVSPDYPEAAKKKFREAEGDQLCKVRMFIDVKGVPTNLTFESCDPVFHKSTRKALMQWRFEPAIDAQKQTVPAQFLLMVRYRYAGDNAQGASPDTTTAEAPEPSLPTRTVDGATVVKTYEVKPLYPRAATDLELGDVVCKARIAVDDRGIPQTVLYDDCPEVFHNAARRALLQWRFAPVQDEQGQPVPAHITVATPFVMSESEPYQVNLPDKHQPLTKIVQPKYPKAAKAKNIGDHVCKVRMFIDSGGVTTEVKFEECHEVFHKTARKALMKWRFVPAKDENDEPIPAQFLLKIKYELRN